jgi:hypothetical protein
LDSKGAKHVLIRRLVPTPLRVLLQSTDLDVVQEEGQDELIELTPDRLAEFKHSVIVCPTHDLFETLMWYTSTHNYAWDELLYTDQRGHLKTMGSKRLDITWRAIPDYEGNLRIYRALWPDTPTDWSLVSSDTAMSAKALAYPCPGSTFSPVTESIREKVCPIFNFQVRMPSAQEWPMVRALDFSKFYTACLYDSKYDFPIFNELCRIEKFDGQPLESDRVYYTRCGWRRSRYSYGPDWYSRENLEYALAQGYLHEGDVTHSCKAARTIPHAFFKRFVERIFDTLPLDDAKRVLNPVVGCMRRSETKRPRSYFAPTLEEADAIADGVSRAVVQTAADADGDGSSAEHCLVMLFRQQLHMVNYVSCHSQVLDLSAVKLDMLERHLEEHHHAVVRCKTDCLHFMPRRADVAPIDIRAVNALFPQHAMSEFFGVKEEPVSTYKERAPQRNVAREPLSHAIKPWTCYRERHDERTHGEIAKVVEGLMKRGESLYLGGPPGCGKSYIIDTVIAAHDPDNTLLLGSTHRAYLNLNGGLCTLASVMQRKLNLHQQWIVVDEVSMLMPSHLLWLWRQHVINEARIILIGDFDQCKIHDEMTHMMEHPWFRALCGHNYVEMAVNKREKPVVVDGVQKPFVYELAKRALHDELLSRLSLVDDCQWLGDGDPLPENNITWGHDTRRIVNTQVNLAKVALLDKTASKCTARLEHEEVTVFVGQRLIFRLPSSAAPAPYTKRGLYNNLFYLVSRIDEEHVWVRPQAKEGESVYGMLFASDEIQVSRVATAKTKKCVPLKGVLLSELDRCFWLVWAYTAASSEGMTIHSKICIHDPCEQLKYDRAVCYTAMTRCTQWDHLVFRSTASQWWNGYIYEVKHRASGRAYVGSTGACRSDKLTASQNLGQAMKRRWQAHCEAALNKKEKSPFYDAIRAHGEAAFTGCRLLVHKVMPGRRDKSALLRLEGYYQSKYPPNMLYNKKREGQAQDD